VFLLKWNNIAPLTCKVKLCLIVKVVKEVMDLSADFVVQVNIFTIGQHALHFPYILHRCIDIVLNTPHTVSIPILQPQTVDLKPTHGLNLIHDTFLQHTMAPILPEFIAKITTYINLAGGISGALSQEGFYTGDSDVGYCQNEPTGH